VSDSKKQFKHIVVISVTDTFTIPVSFLHVPFAVLLSDFWLSWFVAFIVARSTEMVHGLRRLGSLTLFD